MKKIKHFALFLFLLMGMFLVIPSTQVKAEELVIGDWEITTSDTGAVLSGYVGTDDTVTIPTRLGGYNIRTIASGAFEGNKTLIDVTIPKETNTNLCTPPAHTAV